MRADDGDGGLGKSQPDAAGRELSRPELEQLAFDGRRVLARLDAVSSALDEAQTALQATLAEKQQR